MKSMIALPLWTLLMTGSALAADNMTFEGTLRAHACTLHPDDKVISIDFGELGSRNLYLSGGTPDTAFYIRLLNCNTAVARDVLVTFMGNQSTQIPGALALDPGSDATGFAVVLKDAARMPLRLGDTSTTALLSPETTLLFHHRLVVEPGAQVVTPGQFSASGTFELLYP
ncbi:fimbrial protein [Cedecea sp.]|uniref:fimbrial protein n=1 Tax=Cedecea sp. TaxID=1970739 RepID=UPI002F3F2755